MLWNDNRCDEEVAGIVGADLERLGAITHNVLNTMCTLPKLLWLKRHEPASLAARGTMLYPKDYVRLRLTGERATDLSDASGSSFYDVEAQAWSARAAGALRHPAGAAAAGAASHRHRRGR